MLALAGSGPGRACPHIQCCCRAHRCAAVSVLWSTALGAAARLGLRTHACCAGKEAAKGGDVPALEEISLGRFTADKDDIVLSTFKQFQAAYRGLLEGLKARSCTTCCSPGAVSALPSLR